MIREILWWIFAAEAVLGALGMVLSRNPVGSLLSLVVTFFGLAAIYVLLGAFFISAIQVIVYAGAIMVLFLFVIMLLNLGHDYHADLRRGVWLVLGGLASGLIGFVLYRAVRTPSLELPSGLTSPLDELVQRQGAVGVIAAPLFRDFSVAFEVTSVLLLVAAIGAVVLAKRRV
ncbi:MAG: NADH-quinone oxidoreductase subunit J [Gemmatimonadetes bacterium]|nr:NADH-quinone oxidoreductase subunit J [Gemmatimonadota bacterium]